jgi:hypothetical protein
MPLSSLYYFDVYGMNHKQGSLTKREGLVQLTYLY